MSELDEMPQGSSKSESEPSLLCANEPDKEPPSLSEYECELLQTLEDKFSYIYTDEDPKYVELSDQPYPPPPCVSPWFVQNRRPYDRRDNSQGEYSRGRGYNQRERNPRQSGGDDGWRGRDGQWEDRRKGYQGGYGGRRGYQGHGDGYGRDSRDNPYQQRPRRDY